MRGASRPAAALPGRPAARQHHAIGACCDPGCLGCRIPIYAITRRARRALAGRPRWRPAGRVCKLVPAALCTLLFSPKPPPRAPPRRPLGYLSPSVRSTRTAAAQLLAGGATRGLWGPLRDLLRLLLATRVLGTAVIGVVVAVPPALALVVQAVCTWLAAVNTGYCSTPVRGVGCWGAAGGQAQVPGRAWAWASRPLEPCSLFDAVHADRPSCPPLPAPAHPNQLMADPLTRARLEAAVGALDLFSLPLSVVAPQPAHPGAHTRSWAPLSLAAPAALRRPRRCHAVPPTHTPTARPTSLLTPSPHVLQTRRPCAQPSSSCCS